MPIYTVMATSEVAWSTEIEAPDKATAWKIAKDDVNDDIEWDQGYDVHNFKLCEEDEIYCEEGEE